MNIRNVIEFINNNLDEKNGISELIKLENYIINKNYKFTKYDYSIIVKNQKLEKILNNIEKEFIDIEKIGDVSVSIIEIYRDGGNILIDPQREILLKIKNGDKLARKKFIEDNQGLVFKVACLYKDYGIEMSDLVSEGNIGLMKAIEMFDLNKGFRFSTYATHWIRCKIRKYIFAESKVIKVPRYLENKIYKYKNEREKFVNSYGREPSLEEISEITGISVRDIKFIMHTQLGIISLDAPLAEDGESNLEEILDSGDENPEDIYLKKDLKPQMEYILENSNLTDSEREVLKHRYGFYGTTMTLEEISNIIGVTRERIRQIETKALRKIRKSENINRLIEYADHPDKATEYIKDFKKHSY